MESYFDKHRQKNMFYNYYKVKVKNLQLYSNEFVYYKIVVIFGKSPLIESLLTNKQVK